MVAMLDTPEESGPAWAAPMVACELFSSSLCQKPFFSSAINCSTTVWNANWSKATRGRQTHTLGTKGGSGHKLIGRYHINIG